MELLTQIKENIIAGEDEAVGSLTQSAIEQGLPPARILDEGLIAGMAVVGARFKNHEMYLPDVLLAARAMNAGMALLRPLLERDGVATIGKVVLGTVQGDMHDIGKNLVGIMLRGAGFEVIDLGTDVQARRFIDAALENGAGVVGLSALLTTTMLKMKQVVDMVREEGLSDRIKVIVGGAPVSAKFAAEIGADAHGFDAASAVDRVKGLLGVN